MKKFLLCMTTLFILPLLCMPASAHPGKTDENGGHYDQETGEYHYHHGYPAHAHYDMDGDGYVDCPYDFDDQTGHYSGSSSSSVGGTSYRQPISAKKETKLPATKPAITKTGSYERSASSSLLTICILAIAILFLVARKRKKQLISIEEDAKRDIASFREKLGDAKYREQELSTQLSSSKSKLESLEEYCVKLQKENNHLSQELSVISEKADSFRRRLDIPMDVYFINRNIPVRGKIELYKPYGIFTVYVSDRGRCYHTNYFCSSAIVHPEHKYDVIQRLPPCKKCAMGTVEPVPNWYVELRKLDVDLVARQTNEYYEQLEMQYQKLLAEKDNSKSTN